MGDSEVWAGGSVGTIAWDQLSGEAEGLEKGEMGELKAETVMGVGEEMECRAQEAGSYTLSSGKTVEVYTIGGGIGDGGQMPI